GMTISDIPKFKNVPVYTFISGRAIAKASDPAKAAQAFQAAITDTFGASTFGASTFGASV
ncbi:MAG: hypothetical protein AAF267_19240, partial [Deinococcota bacterium]